MDKPEANESLDPKYGEWVFEHVVQTRTGTQGKFSRQS